ncbi:MAG TPA: hypothetical protein VEH84_12585 [Alphaproteobacteria bacterium]|nr:hypothetical protein [Alphaproteobacteria bacterium]
MDFIPLRQAPGMRTNWDQITHIRLKAGKRPDTKGAISRWKALTEGADSDGILSLNLVYQLIEPIRKGRNHIQAIQSDLRCWSNDEDHGNNSQDKGWLELGRSAGG